MRVLGLIPARGGSKGIPRKNARLLGGRPLLLYTADAALAASRLTRVVLTTDDEEIAEIGRSAGLETPFMRPAALAQDDTPMLPVIQHAIDALEARGDTFDAVCLLQPTNPLRSAGLIDTCIELLDVRSCSAVVTVLEVPTAHNPNWVYVPAADGTLRLFSGAKAPVTRRQDLPPAYHREGSVYVTRTSVLRQGSLYGDTLMGVVVDAAQSVNIDDEADWDRAERLLETARV
jgi:CMP-N-acetylneuraminic acid synthetase